MFEERFEKGSMRVVNFVQKFFFSGLHKGAARMLQPRVVIGRALPAKLQLIR